MRIINLVFISYVLSLRVNICRTGGRDICVG